MADVVEGASAAEMGAWDYDVEAGGFEDFGGGFGRGGLEMIVERVGPEEDAWLPSFARLEPAESSIASFPPVLESFLGQSAGCGGWRRCLRLALPGLAGQGVAWSDLRTRDVGRGAYCEIEIGER